MIEVVQKPKVTCSACNAVFTFEAEDVSWNGSMGNAYWYVTCPCCGNIIKLY